MKNLNPTLWRTCRVLAGRTRIRLLRQLYHQPGRCVAVLGASVGIGRSDASQELRRIQSRGLLQAGRKGTYLIYRMETDPQVSSAAPLLKALKTAFSTTPPERDEEICFIAAGLAYPRRVAMAKLLMKGPQTEMGLQYALDFSSFAIYSHLRILMQSGFVRREEKQYQFMIPRHPVAKAMSRLLQKR